MYGNISIIFYYLNSKIMNPYLRNLTTVLCLFFIGNVAGAQTLSRTSVDSQGGTYTTPQLILTFAIGEAVGDVLANTANNSIFTTGFIHPEADVALVLANSAKSLALYPNPTNGGTVKLAFNHVPDGVYIVNIYDANGKLLQTQQVNYTSSSFYYLPLDVSHYSGGTYFIQVVNPAKFQGEVKLIKY